MDIIPPSEQKTIMNSAFRLLARRYFSHDASYDNGEWWKADTTVVSAGAAYLTALTEENDARKKMVISWLTKLAGAGVGDPIGIRRAAIAVFSQSKHDMETILEKTMQQFGDQLYIRHTPSLQQDGIFTQLGNNRSTLIYHSTRPSFASCGRVCKQTDSNEVKAARTIKPLSECCIKSLSSFIGQSSVSGDDCRRGNIRACRFIGKANGL